MPNLASVRVIGHVGRDPETDTTVNGAQRTRFNVAVNVPVGGGESEANWYSVTCFGKLAEVAAQYVTQGMAVYVEGSQRIRTYEGRDGEQRTSVDIKATELQMLSRDDDAPPKAKPKPSATKSASKPSQARDDDGDLPF